MTELTLFDLILKNVRVNRTTKRKDRINMDLIDTTGPVRSRLYGFHLQGYTQSIQLGKLKALKLKPTKCRHTKHISIYTWRTAVHSIVRLFFLTNYKYNLNEP